MMGDVASHQRFRLIPQPTHERDRAGDTRRAETTPAVVASCVVQVAADDPALEPYRAEHGVLAGLAFQRDVERRAAELGGGGFTCPVQVGAGRERQPPPPADRIQNISQGATRHPLLRRNPKGGATSAPRGAFCGGTVAAFWFTLVGG